MITRHKQERGQTLIETALILLILLLILLGITEFSRAWFTKNSLKNAARQGARVAVVTSGATASVCPNPIVCDASRSFTACPGSGIVSSVCASPGLSLTYNPEVAICYFDDPTSLPGTLDRGDTINVCTRMDFATVVPDILGSFIPDKLYADASMRYE